MNEIDFIKKYNKKAVAGVGIAFVALIIILISPLSWLWKIGLCFSDVVFFTLFIFIHSNKIDDILHKELDPQRYHTLCHATSTVSVYNLEDIQTAYYVGDYGNAIGIIKDKLTTIKTKTVIPQYQHFLALCYFETGQFDKLISLIPEFRKRIPDARDKHYKRIYTAFANYYENFLKGDYGKCFEIGKIAESLPDVLQLKSLNYNLTFYQGMALFYAGQRYEAKPFFENCVYGCPKFNYSVLAKKYLDVTESENITDYSQMAAPMTEYTPQEIIPTEKVKLGKKELSSVVIAGIIIVAIVIIANLSAIKTTPEKAIGDYCEVNRILTTIPIDEENSLYVYDSFDLLVGVAAVETKNERNYECHMNTAYDLWVWEEYDDFGFELADIDKTIIYDITDDEKDIPENAVSDSFEIDGKTYYIYIISIEDTKIIFDASW